MKRIYFELLCAALIGAFVSCTPENEFSRSNGNLKSLVFAVSTSNDQSTSTRSGEESYVVDTFVLGDDTLALVCMVTDMDAPAPEAEKTSDTRGVPIYSKPGTGGSSLFNLEEVYGYFNVSGYIVDDAGSGSLKPFFYNYLSPDKKSTIKGSDPTDPDEMYVDIPYAWNSYENTSSSKWEYWLPADDSKSGKFYWWRDEVNPENNYKLQFFAYSPTPDVTAYPWAPTDMNNFYGGITTFKYTVPVSTSTPRKDAEKQPDILVGSTQALTRDDLTPEGDYYVVKLVLYHALSALRFNISSTLEKSDITINSIGLSGLKGSGKCTLKGPIDEYKHSDKMITWSDYGGTTASYEQSFERQITDTEAAGMSETNPVKLNEGKDETTFMLLPQTLTADATLKVKITFEEGGVSKTKTLEHLIVGSGAVKSGDTYTSYGKWEPGKIYTYTISKVPSSPEVTLDDDVTATKKYNFVIENTGLVKGYVRATFVGNWVDNTTGETISSWSPDDANQGSFTNLPGTGWVKGTDGFYYYVYPLLPGEKLEGTEALFKEYNIKETSGVAYQPVPNSHLEMQVLVQIIECGNKSKGEAANKKVTDTWGTSAGTGVVWQNAKP